VALTRTRGSDGWMTLGIASLWIAMAIVAHPAGDFPLNDDWTYARAVEALLDTGRFRLPVETYANALPQVYWGALFCLPFGFSFAALRVSTLTLGLIGVLALYALVREFGAGRRIAAIAALALAVNPLYFGLSVTFMTDVPFAALLTLSAYLLTRSLLRDSRVALALGLGTAVAATLVRQFGVVLVASFAIAFVVRYGINRRRVFLAASFVAAALATAWAVEAWLSAQGTSRWASRPAVSDLLGAIDTVGWDGVRTVIASITYLGWFALPLLVATTWNASSRLSRRAKFVADALAIATCAAIAMIVIRHGMRFPSLTNVLIEAGIGPLTLHDTYVLLANQPRVPGALTAFWTVATACGIVGAGILLRRTAIGMARGLSPATTEYSRSEIAARLFLALAAAGYALALGIFANLVGFFDRYLLPLLPLTLALVASREGSHDRSGTVVSTAIAGALVAVFAVFSALAAHDYVAWNNARWTALRWLTDHEHVAPERIDGGYEFNGWNLYDARYRPSPGKSWWWVADAEYVVAAGPLSGYREVARYPVVRWLTGTRSDIVVLRRATEP